MMVKWKSWYDFYSYYLYYYHSNHSLIQPSTSSLQLHRRLVHDDIRGVDQKLDETVDGIKRRGPGTLICAAGIVFY